MAQKVTRGRIAAAEKEQRVWEMRRQGASYPSIARTPDPDTGRPLYASHTSAMRAARRVLKRIEDAADQEVRLARAESRERLEAFQEMMMGVARAQYPLLDRAGRPVMVEMMGRDGVVHRVAAEDPMPRIAAAREFRLLDHEISDRMGWNAPEQIEVSGPAGGPIQVEAMREQMAERMGQIFALPDEPDTEPLALPPAETA